MTSGCTGAMVELEIEAAEAKGLKKASEQLALELGVGIGRAPALELDLEFLGLCPNSPVPDVMAPYLKFYVPPEEQPHILDWSRSNLERLFDIGYELRAEFS